MIKYNYVFVGAGAATLYPVIYMLKNGIPGANICILEKGKSSLDPTNNDIIHVVGGAGTYSDSKHIFSTQPDLNINEYLGLNNVDKWYNFIQETIKEFHPEPDTISITEPTDFDSETVSGWGSASIAQSLTWHVGSQWGVKLIQEYEKFIVSKGVTLLTETEATFINPNEQYVDADYGRLIYYNKLFICTGRANSKFVNKFLKHNNIELKKTYLDIGCRFETEYSSDVKKIADVQYDFKFKDTVTIENRNTDCRTFCVCHYSSYVAEETKNNEFIGYNGHAYGLQAHDKANNLTNFGILAHLTDIDAHTVMNLARKYKCQVLGDDVKFTPSLPNENVVSKEALSLLPGGSEILAYVEKLKPILKFGENYKIYYPEIKEGSGRLESPLKWRVEQFPNIFFTGDSSFSMKDGGTRGIVPAAVSGLSAIDICLHEELINDNNQK